jgi:hypothetical protein
MRPVRSRSGELGRAAGCHGSSSALSGRLAYGVMVSRIIVLPHIGGPHPQRDRFVARLFVDNLGRYLDAKPLKEVVDRKAGY